jgi:zinc protease
MSPFRHIAITLALGGALAARPAAGMQSAIQRTVLDNGMEIIVIENHAVPLATVLVVVRNGAMTQEPRDQGLAHLYEHVLFRSYRGDPLAFATEATYLKARFNGFTSEEVVAYYLVLPSTNAGKGIELLARMLRDARFSDRDLKDERPVVLDELHRAEADPEQALERRASRLLWGESWSRKDPSGDSASLQGITVERLRETYARYYVPNNAALIITGDVSAAVVIAAARERFGQWERGPDPFRALPHPPIAPMTGHAAVLMAEPVAHATILVQFRGPSANQDTAATYAADVLCDVLNERSSGFQRRLIDNGLFQSIQCTYQTLNHVGPITFSGETTREGAASALNILVAELDELDRLEDVTEENLLVAKRRRQLRGALARESGATLAPGVAYWWASGGMDYYESYQERVNSRTIDDLRQFARRYVVAQPKVMAVLAPEGTIAQIRALVSPPPRAP